MRRLKGEQTKLETSLFYFLSLISIDINKNELVAYKEVKKISYKHLRT